MKRKMISIVVTAVLCTSITGTIYAEEAVLPQVAYEDFPAMDGSLACVPLMEALGQKVTGCSEAEAEELLDNFSNTNPSYIALAEGERDFCIAYEPAEDTVEQLNSTEPIEKTDTFAEAEEHCSFEELNMTSIGKRCSGVYCQ